MLQLLLATGNAGKLYEMRTLLADLEAHLLSPKDIDLQLEVVEDGETYAENASRKALSFSHTSGLVSLADDSGLEVAALGGAPGIHSARFSPLPKATDADRRSYLLETLRQHPRPWKARFHCTVALATPEGEIFFAEGNCPGEIIPEERGHNGFGYDPIFYLPELGCTMAQLSLEQKNRISHRAGAIMKARPYLIELSK